ncbi:PaaI family thioesterase [Salinarimonas soli]|uniref:PaaI family thioesterase n=1 Tax=Salinarimonas soli TaxID=1638099 RepID=A0A5B2VHC8_9HYPH|nr:PaaI family thioesterase [Salinarimonas soli]KAA2237739.1 PaaI family thioesterase [Salinarimonas soli]
MSDPNLEREQVDGSPLQRLLGYRLEAWEPDGARLAYEIRPEHLNRAGLLHGGIITTVLDTAAGYAGVYCATPGEVRRTLTLSFTTSYVASVKAGRLVATGRRIGGGRSIFYANAELHDGDGRLIAHGTGTFRYVSL